MEASTIFKDQNFTAECKHCKKQIFLDELNSHEESCGK